MSPRLSRSTRLGLVWAVVGVLLLGSWALVRTVGDDAAPPAAGASRSATTDRASGLAYVDASRLPAEAQRTLQLITARGPFRYARDGAVFENREGLLPREPRGYYREYTVPTPGSADRGARRVVEGQEGERYWTDDHYASFRRIRPLDGSAP